MPIKIASKGIIPHTRIRPKSFQLKVSAVNSAYIHLDPWRWVSFMDIAELLCGTVVRRKALPSVSVPSQLFDRYGLACGELNGEELLTWYCNGELAHDESARPTDESRAGLYLPLGFTDVVLGLAEQGVVSVSSNGRSSRGPHHSLVGKLADDRTCVLERRELRGMYEITQVNG
jgi:hypothetical protein